MFSAVDPVDRLEDGTAMFISPPNAQETATRTHSYVHACVNGWIFRACNVLPPRRWGCRGRQGEYGITPRPSLPPHIQCASQLLPLPSEKNGWSHQHALSVKDAFPARLQCPSLVSNSHVPVSHVSCVSRTPSPIFPSPGWGGRGNGGVVR